MYSVKIKKMHLRSKKHLKKNSKKNKLKERLLSSSRSKKHRKNRRITIKYRGGDNTGGNNTENLNIFQKINKNILNNETVKKAQHVTNVTKKAFGIIAKAAGPNKKQKIEALTKQIQQKQSSLETAQKKEQERGKKEQEKIQKIKDEISKLQDEKNKLLTPDTQEAPKGPPPAAPKGPPPAGPKGPPPAAPKKA